MEHNDRRLLAYLTGDRDLRRAQDQSLEQRRRSNQRVRNTPFAEAPLPRLRGEVRDPTAAQAIGRMKSTR